MVDLPPEIWRYIANFLPRTNDLYALMGLNRVFFELAMDMRWTRLKLSTGNMKRKRLKRLSDPFVARRLQQMTLILYLDRGPNYKEYEKVFRSLYLPIQGALNFFRKDSGDSRYANFEDVINDVIELGPRLVGICDLTIRCTWNLEPQSSYKLLRPLLISFSSSVGLNLRRLALEGNLDEFRVLLETRPKFSSLEELHLEFKEANHYINPLAIQTTLINIVVPFINQHGPHLATLSFKSYFMALDLSDFFLNISVLPRLSRLDLREAFIKPSHYPSSLIKIFRDNSHSLYHLSLPLIPFKVHLEPSVQEPLSEWLLECIADEIPFTHLRSLDIYPTKTPKSLDILLAYIQRTSNNLTNLVIRTRVLNPVEAPVIFRALAECGDLTDLSLSICQLDLTLLDHLSQHLRRLHRLHLTIRESFGVLFLDLKGRYAHWDLKDIWIMHRDDKVDHDTMLAVARSIPSLEKVFGNRIKT